MKVIITTDGSGTSKGPGGWAAVLRFGEMTREIVGGEAEATNNRMELMAVIRALQYLKRPCIVDLTTDSKYVQEGIKYRLVKWKRYGWTTAEGEPVKNKDLWLELDAELQKHTVEVFWVAGHGDHADNVRCDELAGAERRRLLGKPEPAAKKKRIFASLAKVGDEALRAAVLALSDEDRQRLRDFLAEAYTSKQVAA